MASVRRIEKTMPMACLDLREVIHMFARRIPRRIRLDIWNALRTPKIGRGPGMEAGGGGPSGMAYRTADPPLIPKLWPMLRLEKVLQTYPQLVAGGAKNVRDGKAA
jgi:hypothetical protein